MAKQAHDQGVIKRRARELAAITSTTSSTNSDRRTQKDESK